MFKGQKPYWKEDSAPDPFIHVGGQERLAASTYAAFMLARQLLLVGSEER
jgi:hypothetical protein